MYCPSLKEFLRLTDKGNVIPIYKEINADLDTPVSAYLKMEKDDYAFLLESVEGQERIARYSFLGSKPALVFKSKARNIRIEYPQAKKIRRFRTAADPIQEIKKIIQGYRAVEIKGLPRFYGGLVGYIGYDMVRFFEDIPDKNPDDLKLPDSLFILTGNILIFDHVNHKIKIVTNTVLPNGEKNNIGKARKTRIYYNAIKNIEHIHKDLNGTIVSKIPERRRPGRRLDIKSNFKKSEFCAMVKKAKAYIKRGDVIQVVLSQRFKVKIQQDLLDIYRKLRSLNPSPYMFFLKLKEVSLIGASPEMLVRCEGGLVQTMPIAGTRPRGKTEKEDSALEEELLKDTKEKAEHLMLVDLGRNDLGKVCKPGGVRVSEFMNVERYSHVMHLVSEVKGELNKGCDCYDALRACFPAGTVSGSPKIRAMEIVDELESVRRGPYAGCVGYFSFSNNLDTCITIRTIIVKDNTAYIQAGAGIVADSVAGREYKETVNKAKALLEAIIK